METKKSTEEQLKEEMSVERLEMNVPSLSEMEAVRNLVQARKKKVHKQGLFAMLYDFFNFRIRLYQGGLATVVVALMVFFAVNEGSMNTGEGNEGETISKPDTLKCSSLKENSFLVKNFSAPLSKRSIF